MNTRDKLLFLKSLAEDGVEELYEVQIPQTAPEPVSRMAPARPSAAGESSLRRDMTELRDEALNCTLCPSLCETRTNVVFGSGNLNADLVFVGEAPGRDEDEQGLPFVGAAGQLLTKIIEAIGYKREQVFICNVLKCRPPQNRSPKPEEIMNCSPYLKKQLLLIRPKMICALGNFAAHTLLQTELPMAKLRQKFHEYEGIKLTCTYHPAYLLRNPADKKKVWEDMKMMKRELERLGS